MQLLAAMGSAKEMRQYLQRFSNLDTSEFAVVKVGGGIIRDELEALASALSFLYRVGLVPIVVHGAGPQLDQALEDAGVETVKIDGLRRTDAETLMHARRVFQRENHRIVHALRAAGVNASPITTGVFEADYLDRDKLGFVGRVEHVELEAIRELLNAGTIPVVACLGTSAAGQLLNINGDSATSALVRAARPHKIIYLTTTGGLLDGEGKLISSVQLATDYDALMAANWLHSGMRLKLQDIHDLLSDLPPTSSVAMTRPTELARELFTDSGAGTLVRRGEAVLVASSWDEVDTERIATLVETCFGRPLVDDYFNTLRPRKIYVSESYRALVVVGQLEGVSYMDKFAVLPEARGEGLAQVLWKRVCEEHPQLVWRSRRANPVNHFYFDGCDGARKGGTWTVFWRGEDDAAVRAAVQSAFALPASLEEAS